MQIRRVPLFLLSACLAACTTNGFVNPIGAINSVSPVSGAVREQPSLNVNQSTEISGETLGVAGILSVTGHPVSAFGLPGEVFSSGQTALLYIIYDPLAPNWTIQEKRLNEDTFFISLKAKSFRIGGDGEAIQVFKRRARFLQRENGYSGYRILDYSEGIESSTPLTHRVGEGVFQLVRTDTGQKR